MDNGQFGSTQEVLENSILMLNNHAFHVNLMLTIIRSFNVVVGMDWLSSHHAEILCFEKPVCLPLTNVKSLIVYGNKPKNNLRIISCLKVLMYLHKKCDAILAHVIDKKSMGREIKDIPHVCDYPNVFLEDLPRLPLVRQVEFQIDLVPGATPLAKSPYRLAPLEMKELST